MEQAESAPSPDDPYSHVYARLIDPGPAATVPEPAVTGPTVNLITGINRALHDVMAAYPETVVFGEDVAGRKGGVFKATERLTEAFGENRCFNTPISESLIAGLAVGMGATPVRPIAEIQFGDYIHPGLRPTGVGSLAHLLSLQRSMELSDRGPGSGRRRDPRRSLPLAVDRGLLHPRAPV